MQQKKKILILGGNRFFGLHLAQSLIADGHELTLLNRGQVDDGLQNKISRLKADRKSAESLQSAVQNKSWDLIYDQVCYSASEAKMACEIFKDKTQRYIVTSSESVYDDGENQQESRFDPWTYSYMEEASPTENYQEAKRQVEHIFVRSNFTEVAIVRPSLVVGLDDYTQRTRWHLDRILQKQEIYFPNLNSQVDFIQSAQAGEALKLIGLSSLTDSVNCTTRGSIALHNFLQMCEEAVGQKAILAQQADEKNHSPYGFSNTKTMNTDKLYDLGFKAESSEKWMKDLITIMAQKVLNER